HRPPPSNCTTTTTSAGINAPACEPSAGYRKRGAATSRGCANLSLGRKNCAVGGSNGTTLTCGADSAAQAPTAIESNTSKRFILCRTLQMSHDRSGHDFLRSRNRDGCGRWLWRLVGLLHWSPIFSRKMIELTPLKLAHPP